jgi:glycosyltransferase involved in cell wall biosynthesis
MLIAHLTGSAFLGGPEKQMLGIAGSLPPVYQSVFLCFADHGCSRALTGEVRRQGFEAHTLAHDTPHYLAAVREVTAQLRRLAADVLCCHGYKADILGLLAARRAGVPVVAVAHGWTAATLKVRVNEALDRLSLRWMDRVVGVSEGQAVKVRRAGVRANRVVTIRNAVCSRRFETPDPDFRRQLDAIFPHPRPRIVGAAGRLSPEKGFALLVEAAQRVVREDPGAGFVLFGDGPLREALARQIVDCGLEDCFKLAGFRADLEGFLPHLDVLVLPSFTEGLPVVVLEAGAAGVPVVATAVGGTPEVVHDGVNGLLVPPGDSAALSARILDLLRCEPSRRAMGQRARQRVQDHFALEAQGLQYQRLFESLVLTKGTGAVGETAVGVQPTACGNTLKGGLQPGE